MKNKTTKILLIAMGSVALPVALGFLSARPAPAKAKAPAPPLPVIVTNPPLEPLLASDTVTLQMTSDLSAACSLRAGGTPISWTFDRSVVKSGGTVAPFTLPAGKVLVVTSLDWSATGTAAPGNPSPVANLARTAFLTRAVGGGVNGASAQSTAIADPKGRAGGSEVFPTGIVLQNPGQFCLGMDAPVTGERVLGVLQGYLAPDR